MFKNKKVLVETNHAESFEAKESCDISLLTKQLFLKQQEEWTVEIANKHKLRFYCQFKHDFNLEKYILLNLNPCKQSILA